MARFLYKGRDREGALIEGERDADSEEMLAGQLIELRITPIDISEIKVSEDSMAKLNKMLGLGKPSLDDIILFTRQLYTTTKSGVPIIRGLTLIADSSRNEIFVEALRRIIEDLESGREFSGALARHTHIFSPLFINIVRVGEESGKLEDALYRLYKFLDADKVTIEKIRSALFYPATVVVAIILAITFLMAKVIPKFAEIFDKFNLELPIQTRIIIAASDFIANHWGILIVLVTALIVAWKRYIQTESGRLKWHRYKLRIPKIGDIILRATLARFTRAFSMSNSAGVPILQGLTVTARAMDNDYIEMKIRGLRNDIERGETITRAAVNTGVFTPLVLQMFAVGEETGQMDEMMDEVAEFYEREVAYDVSNITKIIEPILTVIMGLMVLILALGIFLPMWDLVKITQG